MEDYSIFKEINEDADTLNRHVLIIKTLLHEQPLGIIKISQQTGIPEHKIRYSLRILERDGIIEASREGAILTSTFLDRRDEILKYGKDVIDKIESIYNDIKNILESK
ncbi:transcriptional regulator [Acidiplasma sp.]|uniref:transcriptional regulator n=1 Tax=Acidiplasma sp. TaxID=1872114 RepID=UPI002590AFD7|nr:transcriptional regulator [Acidiplasma sp.]